MLVKEAEHYDDTSISVLGSHEIGDGVKKRQKVEDDDDDEDDDFPILSARDLGVSEREKTPRNDSSGSAGQVCAIPVDYEQLPKKFFKWEDIPPPLVSKKWLRSINEGGCLGDETDPEDFLPLIELKNKLNKKVKTRNKGKIREVISSKRELSKKKYSYKKENKKLKATNEQFFVNRKRGRPRKSQIKSSLQNLNDTDVCEIIKEEDEFFWDNETENFNIDIPISEDVYSGDNEEDDNLIKVSQREHNYFKPVENSSLSEKDEDVSEKKKKKQEVIKGVKVGDSKLTFPCLDCGRSFSAASTLKNHLKIHNGTLLKCTECNKGFTTKYLLKCHMRIHSGDLFMCHKCGKGFTTAELLKVHTRGHTGDRPFICNTCGKSFPSASNLSQHKQTHDSEKKFLCFQCGSSFSQKRCLDGHMLTHSEKNHICTVCGKLWARKSDLSEHMRVHTGVKPYSCSICPQKFTQASSLKRHQIVHMDVKPIQCLTCSKMFKCHQYYKRHVRKHEKEADDLFKNIIKDK